MPECPSQLTWSGGGCLITFDGFGASWLCVKMIGPRKWMIWTIYDNCIFLKYLKFAKGNFVGQWSPLFLKNQRRFLEWLAPLRFVSPTWYDVIIIELTWWINSLILSLCADFHRSHQLMAVQSRTLRKFGPLRKPSSLCHWKIRSLY